MKLGILLVTYNRTGYLSQTLESLERSRIPQGTIILITDDASTDEDVMMMIRGFRKKGCRIIFDENFENVGIKVNIKNGYETLFEYGCDVVMNLDSDALVRNDFIEVIMKMWEAYPDHIITGFHSTTKNADGSERHEIIGTDLKNNIYFKKSVGGINMCMSKNVYERFVQPALIKVIATQGNWDHQACIRSMDEGFKIVSPTQSVIQHIGFDSSMKHHEHPDVADSFVHLNLSDVTLIGVDCVDVRRLIHAAHVSMKDIQFGAVKILSSCNDDYTSLLGDMFVKIEPLKSKEAYSDFMIKRLSDYVDTKFALVIQYDGYVLNFKAWTDNFFAYDYIGAKWWYKDGMNVGNGGFSLRSKNLLQVLKSEKKIVKTHPEDHVICRTYRSLLEDKYLIRFAPDHVADKFSIEAYNQNEIYTNQFGFHGHKAAKNMSEGTYVINQFQGLGDILFSMPLIEEWRKKGHKIMWAVVEAYLPIQKHFPDILFVNKKHLNINYESRNFDKTIHGTVIPLRFSDSICGVAYTDCMKSKYLMFSDDKDSWKFWRTLKWKRDKENEDKLFYSILGLKDGDSYTLVNRYFRTDKSGVAKIKAQYGIVIDMHDIEGFTLLDWGKVIENAESIHTVGTSINYIIEILNCKAKEIHLYIRKPDERDFKNYDYILSNKYNYIFHER